MSTDTTEKGLENLVMRHLTGVDGFAVPPNTLADVSPPYAGIGYLASSAQDFDRAHALDAHQLFSFLQVTQPDALKKLGIANLSDPKDLNRIRFLTRVSSEIGKRGIVDVLRKGIEHHPAGTFTLYFPTPSLGNEKAAKQHVMNRFSVSRQLAYSMDETRRALDIVLFVNGLPLITFELKNTLTKQNVEDAIEQYKRDRDPREKLFEMGRCIVHLAVDDREVRMCTELAGKGSWFLPFNKGHDDGAGNPPNPNGLKTDYLWRETLALTSLCDILENYAQIIEEVDRKTGRKKRKQIFPRYHQLDVVRRALADVRAKGAGERYLIQHSAGSGKSNSIAWLSHQLIAALHDGKGAFDSVIVITDRRILDDQIQTTIKGFMQVRETVGHAEHAGDLRRFIEEGKRIIITTVQKFPFILDEVSAVSDRRFAIVIDEAHSSQGGKTSSAMGKALGAAGQAPDEVGEEDRGDPEDIINQALETRMAARKMVKSASYFAFTATPKNKTLEMFGYALPPDAEGKIKHRPFHVYTMKQAIQEKFILDVLEHYLPVDSYYKLVKKTEEDPEFDIKKAKKKLRHYVESHDHAIGLKAEIMVDHFHDSVVAPAKIGGKARAMVVTSGIERAIQYFFAIKAYLNERKSPYRAIVAFSGEFEFQGAKVSEVSINGFPSKEIADRIQEDPYRILVCADKFQTGYDEPLLHTMYVDKPLSGIKAVQTLSRLNRAHPQKRDCFILDFQNNAEDVNLSFQDYYRTTMLSEETDPNKINDLKGDLDRAQVYSQEQVDLFVGLFLSDADRQMLDPILDACAQQYVDTLDEDQQIDFKSKAKVFCRTYDFLAAVLPTVNAGWEKLSILLNLLLPKLPAPKEEDLAKGILDAIDMDSYRVEKKGVLKIALADMEAEIAPPPTEAGGGKSEPELDRLSSIIQSINDQFGTLFSDGDRVVRKLKEEILPAVEADITFRNAKKNTPHNARMAHDQALTKAMQSMMTEDMQIYKAFVENESFRDWVKSNVFNWTHNSGPDTLS